MPTLDQLDCQLATIPKLAPVWTYSEMGWWPAFIRLILSIQRGTSLNMYRRVWLRETRLIPAGSDMYHAVCFQLGTTRPPIGSVHSSFSPTDRQLPRVHLFVFDGAPRGAHLALSFNILFHCSGGRYATFKFRWMPLHCHPSSQLSPAQGPLKRKLPLDCLHSFPYHLLSIILS
jgi:hypothetical protein